MLFLVIIVGFLIRLVNLNQSFWLDEAISAVTIQRLSFDQIITVFSKTDFHPPLYYLFLKLWATIFGVSEISLRFPSIIFGCGTIIFGYLIGKHLLSKKAGLVAALLTSLNPLLVYYSQEARMYSLATFLVSGAVWFTLKKKPFWFVFFLSASLYTDYLPWLMLPVYFLVAENKRAILKWTGIAIISIIPWLPFLFGQMSNSLSAGNGSWGDLLGRVTVKNLGLFPIKFIFGRISFADKFTYAVVFGGGGIFYLALALKGFSKKMWLWFLLPLLLGVMISVKVPVLSYFRFLFVVPPLLILVARGCYKSKLLTTGVVLIAVLSLVWFNLNPRFFREDWRSFSSYVARVPGIVVMPSLAQDAPISYYKPFIIRQDQTNLDLDSVTRVYLLRYVQEVFDPKNSERSLLENAGFKKVDVKDFNGLVTWIYKR